MDDKIVIAHAYRGFTYLPLFLAHELGYFPRGVELAYADGDVSAMQAVLHLANPRNLVCDFAICDPLLIANLQGFISLREWGEVEEPIVIGSLIKRPPLWLFNTNRDITPVGKEESLQGLIRKVRCYRRPNTGYIVARRLLDKLGLDDESLEQVEFDTEFQAPTAVNEVVVTSNILRMGEVGFNNNNTVFSYASKKTDIQDMFFTGIITRQDLFARDLASVLSVLAGLKKAISDINNADPDDIATVAFDAFKKQMAKHQFSPFETTDETRQRAIVKSAIDVIRQEKLYSPDLEVSKLAWERSIALRRPYIKEWKDPEYEMYTREIPVILLRDNWERHIALKQDLLTGTVDNTIPTPVASPGVLLPAITGDAATAIDTDVPRSGLVARVQRTTEAWGTIATALFLLGGGQRIIVGLRGKTGVDIAQNRWAALWTTLSFLASVVAFGLLSRRLFNRDYSHYEKYITWWLTLFALALGGLFAIQT